MFKVSNRKPSKNGSFKIEAYLGFFKTSIMEFFEKIVKCLRATFAKKFPS